ncbi:MAG: UDP-N-acetylmuramoyl-L-alanine--D-glutamate ligase [Pseudomonadota bacterium]
MITSTAFAGKRYAVLGLARSGAATVEALLASGAHVTAWDKQDLAREPFAKGSHEGRCELADPLTIDLTGFDGVVVSPGVPLNTHPIRPHAEKFGVPVIGDIELFALARPELPPHKVVGITGTNGKSTTTALVHHILVMAGIPAVMGGNIGEPIMAQKPLEPNEKGVGVYVLELSSYQIDLTFSLDCDAAALTNITPDHLDRYDGFKAYAFAKGRLFTIQGSDQFAVFGNVAGAAGAIYAAAQPRRPSGRIVTADLEALAELQADWPNLQGPHSLENVAVAVALAEELGVTRAQWEHALPRFRGLPHRMERVVEHNGVTYFNDSKATNTASTAPALAAFPPAPNPRLHWIVGGLAKEDGLGECAEHVGNLAGAYTIGEAGPRFAELLEPHTNVTRCELLCEAVRAATEAAKPSDVILLSPACASFDQFRDYERRGEHFRQIVSVITGEPDIMRPISEIAGEAA